MQEEIYGKEWNWTKTSSARVMW